MILAGAGSGKTRVLACRAAYLVHSGLARPYQILALTFTNKAAGELKSRAEAMVGEEGSQLAAGTFHSIFARLMRREGLNIDVDPNFTIIDTDDRRRLIKAIIKELNIVNTGARPAAVEWMISSAKNSLITPSGYSNQADNALKRSVAEIYHLYERRLKRMHGLDFDDLLIRPLEAFKKHPEFLSRLQDRFRYVMVDEFQDTNRAQYLLVREVARKHSNLCVVGDDDQAIYGWRGATVRNILDFQEDWKDVRIVKLEQNYRSRKPILDAAWSVICNNRDRHPKKLWTEKSDGDKIDLIRAEDEDSEARQFIGKIQDFQKAYGWKASQFAILYRTNAQSLPYERALRAMQIPYHIVGGLRFYERKEVKDVLAFLRIIVNPADDVNLSRIINYPPRGIGQGLIDELLACSRSNNVSISEAIGITLQLDELPSRRRNALDSFVELMSKFKSLSGELSFPDLVKEIVHLTGLKQRLAEEEKDDPSRAESKLANLDSLISDIARYVDLNPQANINDFLEEVALVTEADDIDVEVDRVNLLTLHSAKGLEFPVVLIGGLEDGILPLNPPDGSAADVQEERRLFYVGTTRAMERLILGYTVSRIRWGSMQWNNPSRFLAEISPDLINDNQTIRSSLYESAGKRSRKVRFSVKVEALQKGLDPEVIHNGLLVKHPKFGLGVVVEFHRRGSDSTVKVDFDEVGLKNLFLRNAKLEIVE